MRLLKFNNFLTAFKRQKFLIGINVTATQVCAITLSYTKNTYRIEAYAIVPVTSDRANIDAAIIVALSKIKQQATYKQCNTAIALSHSAVITKTIEVNNELSVTELDKYLRFNLEKYIGQPSNNVSMDYQTLPTTNSNTMKVQLVTVRAERIAKCQYLLGQAGLTAKIIDIDSYALERAIRWQLPQFSGLLGVANIDDGMILLIVLTQNEMIYAHEELLEPDKLRTKTDITRQLEKQLQLCFANVHQTIDQLLLTGTKVLLTDLVESLQASFAFPLTIARISNNTQSAIAIDSKLSAALAISFGLALRVNYA